MPIFVYEGPGAGISIAGRSLDRGQPTVLEGRAAEQAGAHPDVRLLAPAGDAPKREGPTYADLKSRAKELGLPATGKAEELAAAIAAEEARLAAEAAGSGAD